MSLSPLGSLSLFFALLAGWTLRQEAAPAGRAAASPPALIGRARDALGQISAPADRAQALAEIAGALAAAGRLAEARRAAAEIADEDWKAEGWRAVSVALAGRGEIDEARRCAAEVSDDDLRADALLEVALALARAGETSGAREALEAAQEAMRSSVNAYLVGRARKLLAVRASLGQIPEAVRDAEENGSVNERVAALAEIARAVGRRPAPALIEAIDRVQGAARDGEEGLPRDRALAALADALNAVGDRKAAEEAARPIGDPRLQAETWCLLAATDEPDAAAAAWQKADEAAAKIARPGARAIVRARIALARPMPDEPAAQVALAGALAEAQEIPEPQERVRVFCAAARLLARREAAGRAALALPFALKRGPEAALRIVFPLSQATLSMQVQELVAQRFPPPTPSASPKPAAPGEKEAGDDAAGRLRRIADTATAALASLKPLAGSDVAEVETLRQSIRNDIAELTGELGRGDGPRVERVRPLFELLLGANESGLGGRLRELGELLRIEPRRVATIEDERRLGSLLILTDGVILLRRAWERTLRPAAPAPLARQAVAAATDDLSLALDGAYIGPAERQTIRLPLREIALPLGELLETIRAIARAEAPEKRSDDDKKETAATGLAVLHAWVGEVSAALRERDELPAALRSPRVLAAWERLAAALQRARDEGGA